MYLHCFTDSSSYLKSVDEIDSKMLRFQSLKGRLACFGILVEKLLILPFALLFKSYKTFLKFLGVGLSASMMLLTLGLSIRIREFFMRRASNLSKDLADWLFFPFAMTTCFARLMLAFTIHPALYFKF